MLRHDKSDVYYDYDVAMLVYAAYETGNFERGNTILREYAEVQPERAANLRKELNEGRRAG